MTVLDFDKDVEDVDQDTSDSDKGNEEPLRNATGNVEDLFNTVSSALENVVSNLTMRSTQLLEVASVTGDFQSECTDREFQHDLGQVNEMFASCVRRCTLLLNRLEVLQLRMNICEATDKLNDKDKER